MNFLLQIEMFLGYNPIYKMPIDPSESCNLRETRVHVTFQVPYTHATPQCVIIIMVFIVQ